MSEVGAESDGLIEGVQIDDLPIEDEEVPQSGSGVCCYALQDRER